MTELTCLQFILFNAIAQQQLTCLLSTHYIVDKWEKIIHKNLYSKQRGYDIMG